MQELKQVKTRILFDGNFKPKNRDYLDVTATYNMTKRDYCDRNPDMEIETADGERILIIKSLITAIREVKVVAQEVEEVE